MVVCELIFRKDIKVIDMRKRISDQNVFPDFSLVEEYQKLYMLFFDKGAFGTIHSYLSSRSNPCLSYCDCLQSLFLKWNLRGSFTTLEEMVTSLRITEKDFEDDINEDRVLDYIQFIINAVIFVEGEVRTGEYRLYRATDAIFNAIKDNCQYLLGKLGAEFRQEGTELYIVYKNDIASAVIMNNPDIEISITEYLKVDNRGDLVRKGEILCTLAKKLETVESKLKGTEFKQLCTDTTRLLNNIGARHALNPKDSIEAQYLDMSAEELETWYDKTYQMLLACFAVLPYINFKKTIADMRKT